MANFWDLPRPVRDKIYRLHLVREGPIRADKHIQITSQYPNICIKNTLPVFAVSKKVEREAAPIYYSENHFEFIKVKHAEVMSVVSYHRHFRQIRKVTCAWTGTWAHEGFVAISRMKGLQELYIQVDEKAMASSTSNSRYHGRRGVELGNRFPTPQEQLTIVRHPGYSGLLTISGVPHVEFTKILNHKKELQGGPIPGGFLEVQVLPKLMGRAQKVTRIGLDNDTFPFLSLPPEIRNRIYDFFLCIPGPIHPTTKAPSSAPKHLRKQNIARTFPASALSLLAVNKQINKEAFGIFYDRNSFEFYFPSQLHAFLMSLGGQRLSSLRDITLYYYNAKSGGIDLADLTFPMLKQLSGLRRLHIIMHNELAKQLRPSRWPLVSHRPAKKVNLIDLPGIKVLFSLRGITDIKLRDLMLEGDLEEAKRHKDYPNFGPSTNNGEIVKLTKILQQFNKALADAQVGKVNKYRLGNGGWNMKAVLRDIARNEVE